MLNENSSFGFSMFKEFYKTFLINSEYNVNTINDSNEVFKLKHNNFGIYNSK